MGCPKCGRTGHCSECCCVSPAHLNPINVTFDVQCPLCGHVITRADQFRMKSSQV